MLADNSKMEARSEKVQTVTFFKYFKYRTKKKLVN